MKISTSELARRLDLPHNTLLRWIRQGHLPVQQSGETCEFNPQALEHWARQHRFSFFAGAEEANALACAKAVDLLSAMRHGGVYSDIAGQTVPEVLEQALACLPDLTPPERRELLVVLLAREALASTGVGHGVAMPHPRRPCGTGCTPSRVITFFLKQPVDFNAVDHQPVQVMFLLLCPDLKSHLQLLSQLAFCVRHPGFAQILQCRTDPGRFYAVITSILSDLS